MFMSQVVFPQDFHYPEDNPIELGKVNWIRNYDEAVRIAEKKNKPILILFQEVPGCGNCTKYGKEIMSHPLIIELIEDNFVPLAIYNNKKGHDEEILKHFGEPSWNNPVVRFISSYGKSLGNRISNFHSAARLLEGIKGVIEQSQGEIPIYLDLLIEEFRSKENGTEEMYLSMFCFWTGEKEIAKIIGVRSTEAGFMHGKEVVKVEYDKKITSAEKISAKARKAKCADQVFTDISIDTKLPTRKTGKYRKDGQDKYYLQNSKYRSVPMTEFQKSKVNSALGSGMNPSDFLSPRQIKILEYKSTKSNHVDKSFEESWFSLLKA